MNAPLDAGVIATLRGHMEERCKLLERSARQRERRGGQREAELREAGIPTHRSAPDISRIVDWLNGPVFAFYRRRDGLPRPRKWAIECHIESGHPGVAPQPENATQTEPNVAVEATVLTSANGRLMAKSHRWDGEKIVTIPYTLEKHFAVSTAKWSNFDGMAAGLGHLAKQSNAIIIRGEPLPETNRGKCRRLYLSRS